MSFGFSVGDFLATAELISNITSALRHASASSYQELLLELHSLERALHEIEQLKCLPGQEAIVNSVKVAALVCQHPLDEFAKELKKYEILDIPTTSSSGTGHGPKRWMRKVQWEMKMEPKVKDLRAYISAHCLLILRAYFKELITSRVNTTVISPKSGQEVSNLQVKANEIYEQILLTREDNNKHASGLANIQSMFQRFSGLLTWEILTHLKAIFQLAGSIYWSNLQIMRFITKIQSTYQKPSIDTRHTWFQEPVRFEDALGRIMPVPSEYNWNKLEAIILDQFSNGPGSSKVKAGEYLLFNSMDSSQVLTASEFEAFIPGMSITMALIVGRYGEESNAKCPRVGCKSTKIQPLTTGGSFCVTCKGWFAVRKEPLPLPLRPETSMHIKSPQVDLASDKKSIAHVLKQSRDEKRRFKNLSIYFSPLPKTPSVANVRSRTNRRPPRRKLVNYWLESLVDCKKQKVVLGEPRSLLIKENVTEEDDDLDPFFFGNNSTYIYQKIRNRKYQNKEMTELEAEASIHGRNIPHQRSATLICTENQTGLNKAEITSTQPQGLPLQNIEMEPLEAWVLQLSHSEEIVQIGNPASFTSNSSLGTKTEVESRLQTSSLTGETIIHEGVFSKWGLILDAGFLKHVVIQAFHVLNVLNNQDISRKFLALD
ncbi:hypothetical protein G7Y89_g9076 [Cudoniella acicularis]|uniref:Ubiquitin-like domain-containing protein n=1 Tax=Cudoniella acicularis TaxID=354080 RepID=A0A8H4RHJ8_9HELO|nr:hypothetical protein G7Y89_g9076 [Cudoniella acicularis]